MRRVSLRQGADWNMGRVGDKDTFQLRADAPATPVSANDNNAITDRRDWIEKQASKKKKKKKEPKSQIFDEADIGKIVAVSGSVPPTAPSVFAPRPHTPQMNRVLCRWLGCPSRCAQLLAYPPLA